MELRHLRYFVAVADLLHFGRAADQLHIAQPSLSHQIRQLESELQTLLLQRTKRRVRLTDAGRLLLTEAREIIAHADRAAVLARRASRGEIGQLRVGFGYWMNLDQIARAMKRLGDTHPAVRVDLRVLSARHQIAALRDERLDVGFVRPPVTEPTLRTVGMAAEPLVVACPRNHPLASRATVALAALRHEAFIVFPRESVSHFYDLVVGACRDAGFVPHVRHEADHPEMVLRLVAVGLGISLVPASARRLVARGVVFRPLAPPAPLVTTAIACRRDNQSAFVQAFVNAAVDIMQVSPGGVR